MLPTPEGMKLMIRMGNGSWNNLSNAYPTAERSLLLSNHMNQFLLSEYDSRTMSSQVCAKFLFAGFC